MDYWRQVDWRMWDDWAAFEADLPERARLWLVEQGGARRYDEAEFGPEDYLVFGRETAGLPRTLLEKCPEQVLSIPMFNPESRSLNLANSVSVVLYEALRQQGFKNSAS
jgi:tRNA (cytidine/uridine-2'-O-)-methyltransferase